MAKEEFISVRKAAQELCVSEITLRKYIQQRRIKYHKWGPNRVKFKAEDVADFKAKYFRSIDALDI